MDIGHRYQQWTGITRIINYPFAFELWTLDFELNSPDVFQSILIVESTMHTRWHLSVVTSPVAVCSSLCSITAVPHLLHCHPPLSWPHLLCRSCRSCRSCRRCRGQPWPLGPELTLAAVLCWRWAAYSSSRVQFPCVHSAPGAGLKQILNVYISLQILQEKFLKMYPG